MEVLNYKDRHFLRGSQPSFRSQGEVFPNMIEIETPMTFTFLEGKPDKLKINIQCSLLLKIKNHRFVWNNAIYCRECLIEDVNSIKQGNEGDEESGVNKVSNPDVTNLSS